MKIFAFVCILIRMLAAFLRDMIVSSPWASVLVFILTDCGAICSETAWKLECCYNIVLFKEAPKEAEVTLVVLLIIGVI